MTEALFALVLIFSPSATTWTEEVYMTDLTSQECDAAQKAVWAQNWAIVGYDEHGMGIPEADAFCTPMEVAPVQFASYTVE